MAGRRAPSIERRACGAYHEWAGDLVQEQDDLVSWLEESVEVAEGSLLTLKEAFAHYRQRGGGRAKGKFTVALKQLLTSRGILFKEQSTRDNARVANFWDGLGLIR